VINLQTAAVDTWLCEIHRDVA